MRKNAQNQVVESENMASGIEGQKIHSQDTRNSILEGKERYYQELVANCFDGVWLVGFDPPIDIKLPISRLVEAMLEGARILEANDSMARMYGFRRASQITGRYCKEWFPKTPPNMEIMRSFAQNNFRLTNVISEEKDEKGNTIYIENSTIGILKGQLLKGIWGVQRDVTARRKMEEAREYSFKIEQTLGKISSLFLTIEDLDQCINAALCEAGMMLRVSRAYLFQATEDGTKGDDTHEWVAPGVTPQIQNMQGMEASSFPWWMEQLIQNKVISVSDVDQLPEPERSMLKQQDVISVLVIPIYSGEKLVGFLGFDETRQKREWQLEEITFLRMTSEILARAIEREKSSQALKASEERFQLFQSSIFDVIYRYDPANNRYDFISPSVVSQTSYSVEEFNSNPLGLAESITHPEDWLRIQTEVENQIKTGPPGKPFLMEYRITRKDGAEIWISDQKTLEYSEDGKLNRVNGVAHDITERKRAEKKLRRYAQKMKEKNRELSITRAQLVQKEKLRALGQMASGMAHDFNNFLAVILGRTQLLQKKNRDLEVEKGLAIIEKAVQDASSTVKRIQNFAQVRKDQDFSWVNMDDLIEDVIAMTQIKWKVQAEAMGATIKLRIEKDRRKLPPVTGDESELKEVLTSLIFNAVEAMPRGGELMIKTRTDRKSVFVYVGDSGVGIPAETKRKIFDPFFTTKGVKNSGLGLSVAYGIIQRHGGDIWAESNSDKGTNMVVRLPVRPDLKKTADEKPECEPASSVRFPAHILVIEDEEDIRQLLFDILTPVGYRVTVSSNGPKGLEACQKDKLDLVITDLGMPEMSGWEVTEAIKKMNLHVPVLLLTSWGMELDPEKLKNSQIDQVIPKPIHVDSLLQIIAETLESEDKKTKLAGESV